MIYNDAGLDNNDYILYLKKYITNGLDVIEKKIIDAKGRKFEVIKGENEYKIRDDKFWRIGSPVFVISALSVPFFLGAGVKFAVDLGLSARFTIVCLGSALFNSLMTLVGLCLYGQSEAHLQSVQENIQKIEKEIQDNRNSLHSKLQDLISRLKFRDLMTDDNQVMSPERKEIIQLIMKKALFMAELECEKTERTLDLKSMKNMYLLSQFQPSWTYEEFINEVCKQINMPDLEVRLKRSVTDDLRNRFICIRHLETFVKNIKDDYEDNSDECLETFQEFEKNPQGLLPKWFFDPLLFSVVYWIDKDNRLDLPAYRCREAAYQQIHQIAMKVVEDKKKIPL